MPAKKPKCLCGDCRLCRNRKAKRQWRQRNREYDREWKKQNPERQKVYVQRWLAKNPDYIPEWRNRNRDKLKQSYAKYCERYPERHKAYQAVSRALRKGKLTKGPCEVCGNPNVHGHHEDYSRPLDVKWLCPRHH